MQKPESLLSAAKKVAQAANLPWSEVQPVYRALQEPGGQHASPWLPKDTAFLPKSTGRNIWAAHPNYITRLLVALAVGRAASEAHQAVDWVFDTTPNGRSFDVTEMPAAGRLAPIERELSRFLTDAEAADELVNVEFNPADGVVLVNTKSQGRLLYRIAPESRVEGRRKDAVYFVGVITGYVFQFLARNVDWRLDQHPPMEHDATASDEE